MMAWRVITYRLPPEPSRHRVAVWRELRRLGAVSLQQGAWAVPDGEPFEAGFAQVVEEIKAAGGQPVVLAVADDQVSVAQLEASPRAIACPTAASTRPSWPMRSPRGS
jgi:DNA-binding transcriptional regulator PaaX